MSGKNNGKNGNWNGTEMGQPQEGWLDLVGGKEQGSQGKQRQENEGKAGSSKGGEGSRTDSVWDVGSSIADSREREAARQTSLRNVKQIEERMQAMLEESRKKGSKKKRGWGAGKA